MLYWHYTTGDHFLSIVTDGVIVPATAFIEAHERPIVWFSANQEWEPTAVKLWQNSDGTLCSLTREQTQEKGHGLARFGVPETVAPHSWPTLKRLSRMRPKKAKKLAIAALAAGSDPLQWRGSFEPVPRDKWAAVDVFDDVRGWVGVLPEPTTPVGLEPKPAAAE
jgi:hypothetical protein